jgi:hypothetical protein
MECVVKTGKYSKSWLRYETKTDELYTARFTDHICIIVQ